MRKKLWRRRKSVRVKAALSAALAAALVFGCEAYWVREHIRHAQLTAERDLAQRSAFTLAETSFTNLEKRTYADVR